MQDMNITHLACDHSTNFAVVNSQSIVFWGWPMCTKTTYKLIDMYQRMPGVTRLWQNYMPWFKAGQIEPIIEAEFLSESIKQIGNLKSS